METLINYIDSYSLFSIFQNASTNLFIRVNHILFYSIAIIFCSCGKHTAQDWFVFPVVILESLLFIHDLSLVFFDFPAFIYRLYNLYNNYRAQYSPHDSTFQFSGNCFRPYLKSMIHFFKAAKCFCIQPARKQRNKQACEDFVLGKAHTVCTKRLNRKNMLTVE